MRKKRSLLIFLCLSGVLLTGCTIKKTPDSPEIAAEEPVIASTPEPLPTAAPEPEPSVYDTTKEIVLRGDETREELADLPNYRALERVDATAFPCGGELTELYEAMKTGASPDCVVEWTVPLYGEEYSSLVTELDFAGRALPDNGELMEKLGFFPQLERVNFLDSGLTHADAAPLADRYEQIRFLWMVEFGVYAIRSDAQVFSTRLGFSNGMGGVRQETMEPLFRYCPDLVALDIGHNQIHDLRPLAKLKHLKVLIIADNGITDISPLAELTELEYLEMFLNREITDFTPLNALTKMVDLNLSYCRKLNTLEFVEYMPALKRCWLRMSGITQEQVNEAAEKYPEVHFQYAGSESATCGTWRVDERNIAIRTAFAYYKDVVAFHSWDDVVYREGVKIVPARPEYG